MLFLLNCTSEFEQLLWDILPGLSHHLLQLTCMTLVPRLKEGITDSIFACPSPILLTDEALEVDQNKFDFVMHGNYANLRSTNTMNIIFNCQRESVVNNSLNIRNIQT